MALKVLLQDHQIAEIGLVKAGEIIDESERRYTLLSNSKAPFVDHDAQMDAVIASYRLQRASLPSSSTPSLYVMLLAVL